jgi:photosystem II stability/assembly factor-like uncharacterized protein
MIYICGWYREGGPKRKPRIWKSTDGGSNFTTVYSDTVRRQARAICVHPTNSDIVYAGLSAEILRSTDAGASWSAVSECSSAVLSLATSPADSDVVYAGTDSVVYKSTDAGVSWFDTGPGIRGRDMYGLAVRSTDADLVYVANDNTFDNRNSGFYMTTDGGSSWFESNRGISLARIPGFDLAPSSPSTIYAQFYITRVYKTTNSGGDWTELPGFTCVENITDFAVNNAHSDTVLCIEGPG